MNSFRGFTYNSSSKASTKFAFRIAKTNKGFALGICPAIFCRICTKFGQGYTWFCNIFFQKWTQKRHVKYFKISSDMFPWIQFHIEPAILQVYSVLLLNLKTVSLYPFKFPLNTFCWNFDRNCTSSDNFSERSV